MISSKIVRRAKRCEDESVVVFTLGSGARLRIVTF